jgi:RNA polymerase sigma-70 factor, ECF subfamily
VPRRMSEAALVRAAQRGSEDAVAQLFTRHWASAYRAAFLVTGDRAAAEDIAQEAFLSALRALPRFDRRRPLRPWLHRIVVNRAIDWARARRLRAEVDVAAVPEPGAAERRNDPGLGELGAALARLSPDHRAVVVMRYLLELTPGEIAEALDLPRGTVNSRLRRGLDALGGVLEEEQ